jgi:hypothetical protein
METANDKAPITKHKGSCHCGDVRLEVEIDATRGSRCNCSICTKLGAVGAIVKPEAFKLLTPEDRMGAYAWGGKVSTCSFCKRCGVYCFGREHLAQLGGDFVSVNLNVLDDIDPSMVKVMHWDGRHDNWMAGMRPEPWPIVAER